MESKIILTHNLTANHTPTKVENELKLLA